MNEYLERRRNIMTNIHDSVKRRGDNIWGMGRKHPYWVSNKANITAEDDLTPEEIRVFITENKGFQLIKALVTG